MSVEGEEPKLNDGHWIEAIHTAHLAQEFFNGNVREHVLVEKLEKEHPALRAALQAATDALYDVYNTLGLLDCDRAGDECDTLPV